MSLSSGKAERTRKSLKRSEAASISFQEKRDGCGMFAMVFFEGARGNIGVFRAPFLFDHKTLRLAIAKMKKGTDSW
jgi:hypothetical protein